MLHFKFQVDLHSLPTPPAPHQLDLPEPRGRCCIFRLTYTAYLLYPLLINWAYQNQQVGVASKADLHSLPTPPSPHQLVCIYQNQEVGAAFQAYLHCLPTPPSPHQLVCIYQNQEVGAAFQAYLHLPTYSTRSSSTVPTRIKR